ncbi:MAG: glycosyltransferase family 9 protein [Ignavibacteria bacterium]|nr:glycosyltransferase family 9 protein [Ignavibacteria bacterium]
MLTSVPLFRALIENIPDCRITLIASPDNIKAVRQNEMLSNIILFDKKKLFSVRYIKYLATQLRGKKFELGLVPVTVSISFTSGILVRLAKCKYLIGPSSLDGKLFSGRFLFNSAVDFDWRENTDVHISKRILKILEPIKISTKNLRSHILITETDRVYADKFFNGVDKPKIGLHIGAGKIQNRWSVDNFAELMNKLNSKYNPFFFLTVGQMDEELYNQLHKMINFDLIPMRTQTIPQIAAVIEKSDLFISNDTGIMHVAGVTNCPMISLFGPTNPKMWSPIGENKYFIKKENDINSIQVDDVLEFAERILNETY